MKVLRSGASGTRDTDHLVARRQAQGAFRGLRRRDPQAQDGGSQAGSQRETLSAREETLSARGRDRIVGEASSERNPTATGRP
ncbi:hypothetical protein GCM10022197_13160 [Microlunatus spumicola]|uniref:Uncharacterized protein n=1 Tax=Microlunatus spumicola TaxID=81499 RepID=A0ABP6X3V4_9ACTN